MNTINFIGLGHWGPNLVRVFLDSQRVTVGLVCDLSQSRLATVQRNISPSDPHDVRSAGGRDRSGSRRGRNRHADEYTLRADQSGPRSRQARAGGKAARRFGRRCRSARGLGKKTQSTAGHRPCVSVQRRNSGREKSDRPRRSWQRAIHLLDCACILGPLSHRCNALWDLGSHDVSIFNYWLDADRARRPLMALLISRRASKTWWWQI